MNTSANIKNEREREREGISVQKLSMWMSRYFLEKGWKIHSDFRLPKDKAKFDYSKKH